MKNNAVSNGLWNALSTSGVLVVGLAGSILVVRSLSTTEYGTFQYYAWLLGVLGVVGTLAFPKSLTKIASEYLGRDRPASAAALITWSTAALLVLNALLAAAVLVWASRRVPPQSTYLLIIAASLPMHALSRMLISSFWAHERFRAVATANSVALLAQLVVIVGTFLLDWGIAGYLVAQVIFHAGTAVALATASARGLSRERLRLGRASRVFPLSPLRRYAGYALPSTLLVGVQAIVWQRSEVFFLERYASFEQIGYYGLAFTVYAMFLSLGWALVGGFHPSISRAYGSGDVASVEGSLRKGIVMAIVFAAPLTFGAMSSLDVLITILYGSKMLPAVGVAHVLFLTLLPAVLSELYGHAISAMNRPWLLVRLGVLVTIVNIALDLALIPRFGAIGAAAANAAAQASYALLIAFAVARVAPHRAPVAVSVKIVVAAFVTCWALPSMLRILAPGTATAFLAIPVAAGAYIALLRAGGVLQEIGDVGPAFLRRFIRAGRSRPGQLRPRVLHVLGDRILPRDPDAEGVSGIIRAPLELALAQARRGYDVHVVAVGDRAWSTEWRGVRLTTLRRGKGARIRWRGRTLDLRPFIPYLALTLRTRFDVLHSHHYYYQRFLPIRRKFVHVHQDPLGTSELDEEGTRKSLHFTVVRRHADACFAVSDHVASSLRRLMGEEAAVHTVLNGIDRKAYEGFDTPGRMLRRRLGVRDDEILLLYAGAFVPGKGVHVLADAFASLRAERPGVHLALAGGESLWSPGDAATDKHGTYLADLASRFEADPVRGRIHPLGRLARVGMAAAYAAADVVVVPSVWQEGFNLVAVEAAASGRPVVASRSGGLIEVAERTGALLVPPGDADALARTIRELVDDPRRREALGRAGRIGSRAFDWDAAAESVERIYFPPAPREEVARALS